MTRDLDTLVRDAARVTDDDVRALALDDAADALARAIVADDRGAPGARAPRAVRRLRAWSALGAAAAAAVAAVVLLVAGGGGTHAGRAWAAPALRVANTLPRYVIGEDGWKVTRADQFSGADAEMTVANGAQAVDLHWRPGRYGPWLEDRERSTDPVATVDVLGERARVLLYDGTPDDFTALWKHGRYTMELRAARAGLDRATFLRLLASLRIVDVDTWLSAMPASAVKPVDQEKVVGEMLAGVPLPDGFDKGALPSAELLRDRYQLGARVTGAVACAWITQWADARRAGEGRAEREAVGAMATSKRWAILREMRAGGDWPKVLWAYADAMAGKRDVPSGGKPAPIAQSARSALGCDGG